MARPIKATPILSGKDAERFYMRMAYPTPLSEEEKAKNRAAYEMLKAANPDCELFR